MTESTGYADFAAKHSPGLLRIGWLLTGTWPAAEELVQTTLAHAYLHWAGVEAARRPAWVRSLTLRTYVHSAAHPEPPAAAAHERDSLQGALAALTPRQRAVAVLRYYVGLDEQQTAAELRRSPGGVRRDASTALAALRVLADDPTALPARLRELTPDPPPDSAVHTAGAGTFTVPGSRPTSVWVAFAVAALIVALLAALVLAIRDPGPQEGSGLPRPASSAASTG